jgi:hypothetical protein
MLRPLTAAIMMFMMRGPLNRYKAVMPEILAQLGGEPPEKFFGDMHIEKPFMLGLESIDAAMQEAQEKAAAKIKEMKEKVKLGMFFGKK